MNIVEKIACPECGDAVPAAGAEPAEIVVCPGCAADLEVVAVDPVVLALAPEIEEDWGE
ncbi:alpha-aminoadipate carrier protein LysW [Streptosporangium becharense]|uniref:Alpha-aminoadipate carrier protein LysW n=1 Tax=Streptosporangium becharense TaxID=1816182 RepID=A0A7W9ILX7_9ACTN|nr:lysine biosynthesis protein LysW [Streptosporangium becharense]MBB2910415.1 alpha-aminoadipate carrier protein LysW [Streptosporangium becharense]MBB5823158.1 alpha-aminoadipate carrier protein LysW [Streptosporangium becharense]